MASAGRKIFQVVLSLAFLAAGRAEAVFLVEGGIFTEEGLSGTASDSPSFGTLAAFRWDNEGKIAEQNNGPVIFPATVMPDMPAYFLSDTDTPGQWQNPVATAGQTTVAVVETCFGRYGWAGGSHVSFQKETLSDTDINNSQASFGNLRQWTLPALSLSQASAAQISLTWTALPDSSAIISSYTIYRATYLPNGTYRTYGTNEIVDTVPAPLSGSAEVIYTDAAVAAGNTYYYTLAINFSWPGVVSATAGARPDQPFYTTLGQSTTVSATALDNSPTPTETPSATLTPTPTLTASFTPTETPSATETPTGTETPADTVTATGTPTATPTGTFTASASPTATALPYQVTVKVFDSGGSVVRLLYDGGAQSAQSLVPLSSPTMLLGHDIVTLFFQGLLANGLGLLDWDGKDDGGSLVNPGQYTFNIKTTDSFGASSVIVDNVLALASTSPTPSPTLTPTPTPTPATSPTATAPPTSTPAALASGEFLAPVPARGGQMVRLYSDNAIERTKWQVYDMTGALVSKMEIEDPAPCWQAPSGPARILAARIEISYASGEKKTRVFKIAVLP